MTKFERLVLRALAMILTIQVGTKLSARLNNYDRRDWEYNNAREARNLIQVLREETE